MGTGVSAGVCNQSKNWGLTAVSVNWHQAGTQKGFVLSYGPERAQEVFGSAGYGKSRLGAMTRGMLSGF